MTKVYTQMTAMYALCMLADERPQDDILLYQSEKTQTNALTRE